MKLLTIFFTITVAAATFPIPPQAIQAAEQGEGKPAAAQGSQRTFATPDEAIDALKAAAESQDRRNLLALFGPEYNEIATGDKVQDTNNTRRFAAALAEGCKSVPDGEDKITLEIGTNSWPMPIPLVKAEGKWHFDTTAGKEEIINRHIGKDELTAIGVCRAYVTAQRQYAGMNTDASSGPQYAMKFKSSEGKRDGLYWPATGNEPASPFGQLVAEAHAEGYGDRKGPGPHPFHGYSFRILTRQGKAAPGGSMNYISGGNLTRGFALVAYPQHWDQSGIMTFIVNQDGTIYQRNLGAKTAQIGGSMKEYNPDNQWTVVQDEGVRDAVSEK